jgi:hypothetical protein
MTDSPHNYSELLELAVLDAHGLLDPIESELFNRSFHNAPASVQDEIVRLQHRLATDESLLPSDLPAASLKGKVIDAVAKAADNEAKRLAPLALIGARVGAARGNINTTGSVALWRTAAMILFGVSLVLAIMTLDIKRDSDKIAQKAETAVANDLLKKLTNTMFAETIKNPYYKVTQLERTVGNQTGYIRVAIYSEPVDGIDSTSANKLNAKGYVFGLDLVDGEEITIQGVDESGKTWPLTTIVADGSVVGQHFEIPTRLAKSLKEIKGFNAKTGEQWAT